jgi:hypothetical protein
MKATLCAPSFHAIPSNTLSVLRKLFRLTVAIIGSGIFIAAPCAAAGSVTTAPTYSPVSAGYHAVQKLTVSDSTSGAVIYYTTNGSTPTISSTRYTGPISVSASANFQFIAVAPGYSASGVTKAWYTITLTAATPVISPASGTYNSIQSVTIADSTPNSTIYYTLDGTYPTASSPVYKGAIKATTTTNVVAIASATQFDTSGAAQASYAIVAPAPSITPESGTYTGTATVTMSDAVSGAAIHYTTDGSTPTSSSPVYTGPIKVSPTRTSTEVYQALATASGYYQSSPSLATFTVALPSGMLAQANVSIIPKFTFRPDFLGLSMDWNFPSSVLGQASTGANQPFRTLVKNLQQYSEAPLLIRVLADDSENSDVQTEVEPLAELAQAVDVDYVLGVDMYHNDVTIAEAEASTWMSRIPSNLIKAWEIGNEPNVYPVNHARPVTYGFADFLPQYQEWVQLVHSSAGPHFGIMGPSYGTEDPHVQKAWVAGTQTALASKVMSPTIVSQHAYISGPGTFPPDYLLEPSSTLGMLSVYSAYAASAHQTGAIFRLGEMNSIYGGGMSGISNTFSAALWSIDLMFNVANVGVDGVNWHSAQGTAYQLYQFGINSSSSSATTYTVTQVGPLYYGLLVFAQMAGHGAKLLPVTTTTDANVSIWATVDGTSTAHVVVINKDETATGNVTITLPGYSTGTVRYLSAASYAATNGITLGGQTFDESPQGTLRGDAVTATITADDGVFTLANVPITSAAVIDFSK